MAGKRTEMSKIKQILLLHKDGMSNRKIGERLGLYKETVNKYVNAAKSDSKSIEELIKMDEPELQHRFSAGNAAYSDKRFDALQEDLEYYVRELERRHVTPCTFYGKNTGRNIRTVTDTRSSVTI